MKKLFVITILSDSDSWINSYIQSAISLFSKEGHNVRWVHHPEEIETGDFVFCLGCGQLVPAKVRERNRHTLVVHESALPKGRGWSPLTWQILEGEQTIPITLLEAEEKVDSGTLYLQKILMFKGTELIDELRASQAEASIDLCLEFIENYPDILQQGYPQQGEPSYYARRRPADSQLDPDKTLREQFNLLRVVDNARYPAFFQLGDETYYIKVEKVSRVDIAEEVS